MKTHFWLQISALTLLGTAVSPAAGTLVAYYNFDDPSDLGRDSSGMGNHADVTNVEAVEGMFGGGAFFDESQSSRFVKNGGLAGFTGKPGQTFAAWVKLDPRTTGWDGVISLDAGGCCETRLLLSPTNFPFINLSQHSDRHLTAAPQFMPDVWMHIAMTGEDVGANSLARVYVNGVEVEGSPQMFPLTESAARWNMYLGAGEAGNPHKLTGTLDEMRIYEGLLTEAEIQAVMTPSNDKAQIVVHHDSSTDDLTIRWASQSGKLYTVRSETDPSVAEPSAWSVFDSQEGLEATPPENSLVVPLPGDAQRYFVVEEFDAPPEQIFGDDFESGQGDWTTGSDGDAGTAWELGAPSGVGPAAAHSPDNCFATNLSSDYGLNAEVWLRSPPIDLTTAGGATLNYFQFKDIEEGFDLGQVAVLDAGDDSQLAVIEATVDGVDFDWTEVSKSIPDEALGKMVKIEFRFMSDDLQTFAGWYIDDVSVTVP